MRAAEAPPEPSSGPCLDCGAPLAQSDLFCPRCGSPRNTSGRGRQSIVPPEVKRWNWGAFLLSWIWGLGNRVYVALWALLLGPIMAVILGIKGNEWAWRKKRWQSVEAFRRTQRRWALGGVAYLVLVAAIVIIVAAVAPTDDERLAKTLVSDDGTLEMRVPETWRELELNDVASLEAGDELAERYALVIEDSKANFAELPTLEDFADEVNRTFMGGLDSATVTGGPESISVRGNPAVRYEIRAVVEDLNVVYLQTIVETKTRYLQILAWTFPSEYPQARPVLQRVILSVSEA